MNKPIHIGIAGLGTVGVGVAKILAKKKALLAARAGRKIRVTAVSAQNKRKNRGIDVSKLVWHDNPRDLALDDNVDVVVELIGGADGAAYDLCKTALKHGKSVVTANKALIATHGMELAALAEKHKAALMFEAAVAGGIPVIKTIKEGLAANSITKITGILNGTCNYILTAMEKDGQAFETVLKEAQELGYAEADPTFDVDGIDTAHKLAILTSLCFGTKLDLEHIHIEGIRTVTLPDIVHARELGYRIRLLGIARQTKAGIEQRVHPCLVSEDSPLARVEGVLNGLAMATDSLGGLFLEGAGAGEQPTASSVVADIVDIAADRAGFAFGQEVDSLADQNFIPIDRHEGAYYIRLKVEDAPGVLASLTSELSNENIGVESVLQKAPKAGAPATIVLITHDAKESAVIKALKNIGKMRYVVEEPHVIRVEE